MKHLQSFNELKILNKILFKDESTILQIIKSIKEVCPPKNLKNIYFPSVNIKKSYLKPSAAEKFQMITFYTTIKKDVKEPEPKKSNLDNKEKGILQNLKSKHNKGDFYIANVKMVLFYDSGMLRSNMYKAISVNNYELECSEKSKNTLYWLLCDYTKKYNL